MKKRKIHDITLPISESMVVWPGDTRVRIVQTSHLDRGDASTVSELTIGAHTGTHVDAPSHFISGGASVETLDLNVLIGPALVIDLPDQKLISAEVLDTLDIPPGTERILFRTQNSERWKRGETEFSRDFVGITKDGARALVSKGLRLVGTDYLSVAAHKHGVPVHKILLGAGIILLETLNLSDIKPGIYELVCLPLKLAGVEGAPCRAILIE